MSQPQRNYRAAIASTENQSVTRGRLAVRAAGIVLIATAALAAAGCSTTRHSKPAPTTPTTSGSQATDAVIVTDAGVSLRVRPPRDRQPGEVRISWGHGGRTDGLPPAPSIRSLADGTRVTVIPRSASGSLILGPAVWSVDAAPFRIVGGGCVGTCDGDDGVSVTVVHIAGNAVTAQSVEPPTPGVGYGGSGSGGSTDASSGSGMDAPVPWPPVTGGHGTLPAGAVEGVGGTRPEMR